MVTRIQTPAPLRAVSERGHSEVRARLGRPVGAERSDWTRLGFKHRAGSWGTWTGDDKSGCWGTRQRVGREPGQEQISATAEAVQGVGERTGVAGGPGQVLRCLPGLEARVHLLLRCLVHWSGFHGNARVFSFQIRSQRMEKDPGLGARSSGESSLCGRNGKSCG